MPKFITIGRRHGAKKTEIILGPETPAHEHHSAVREMITGYPINEEFESVQIFELHPSTQEHKFRTKKGQEAFLKTRSDSEKAWDASNETAKQREAQLQKDEADKKAKKQAEELAKVNAQHDPIRLAANPSAKATPEPSTAAK